MGIAKIDDAYLTMHYKSSRKARHLARKKWYWIFTQIMFIFSRKTIRNTGLDILAVLWFASIIVSLGIVVWLFV